MDLTAFSITKYFGDLRIFKDLNFSATSGQCLIITGHNGSGKTTLMRVLSNLIQPTNGKIIISHDGKDIKRENTFEYIGFIGPYLELYQDLTAIENLTFFAKMKRVSDYKIRIETLMKELGLAGRENDPVKTYSSGMKQRLKYVFALLNKPEILFVDEPRSNLDEEGVQTIYNIFEQQKKSKILIMATNDTDDLKFADKKVSLNE